MKRPGAAGALVGVASGGIICCPKNKKIAAEAATARANATLLHPFQPAPFGVRFRISSRTGKLLPGIAMTLCPVALAVGCKKCPVFKVCPAKSTLGDYRPEDKPPPAGTDAKRPPGKKH